MSTLRRRFSSTCCYSRAIRHCGHADILTLRQICVKKGAFLGTGQTPTPARADSLPVATVLGYSVTRESSRSHCPLIAETVQTAVDEIASR